MRPQSLNSAWRSNTSIQQHSSLSIVDVNSSQSGSGFYACRCIATFPSADERTASSLTVHLALVRQDDLAPAAGWIYSQCLLKALLDVGAPHALGVSVHGLVQLITPILQPLLRAAVGTPLVGRNGAGSYRALPRAPTLRKFCEKETRKERQREREHYFIVDIINPLAKQLPLVVRTHNFGHWLMKTTATVTLITISSSQKLPKWQMNFRHYIKLHLKGLDN